MTTPAIRAALERLLHDLMEGKVLDGAIADADAALAEQPARPTDDQIDELWDKEAGYYELYEEVRNVVRTALAQCGQPAATPIPVAEPLPKPEDCDAEGRCWWLTRSYPPGAVFWELSRYSLASTHWLPVNALPVPAND
jgi:hypothetical protein